MIYAFSIAFTLFFVFYFKWQHKDKLFGPNYYAQASKKWHLFGLLMRATFFLSSLSAVYFKIHWQDVLLALSLSAPLYDIGINVFALNKPPFYPGGTSSLDKLLGNLKWIIYLILLATAVYFKFFH